MWVQPRAAALLMVTSPLVASCWPHCPTAPKAFACACCRATSPSPSVPRTSPGPEYSGCSRTVQEPVLRKCLCQRQGPDPSAGRGSDFAGVDVGWETVGKGMDV